MMGIIGLFSLQAGQLQLILAIIFLLLLITIIFSFRQHAKLKWLNQKLNFSRRLLSGINANQTIDVQMNSFLDHIIDIVEAEGYYLYLFDSKTSSYLLKITREVKNPGDSSKNVGPSYSGLVPYHKEIYNPPLGMNGPRKTDVLKRIKDGEVPLLEMSLANGEGLVRIGPLKAVSKLALKKLEYLTAAYHPVFKTYLEIDKLKNDVTLIAATGKAISGLAQTAFHSDALSARILSISAKMLDAGGCALLFVKANQWELPILSGLDQEIEKEFRKDKETWQQFLSIVTDKELGVLSSASREFYKVPYYFVAAGIRNVFVLKLTSQTGWGAAVFWQYQIKEPEQHRLLAAQMLIRRLGDVIERQAKLREMSDSYIEMLRMLTEATDNMDPYTVGHSQLVSNYATAIATQMGLSKQQILDIRLSAYFHDVGMLGLSNELLSKQGKFSAVEFESMKIHSSVGAAIIESTIGNQTMATLIKHHHERWDGYGYPDGLTGEEIPLGSRIIAVADTFNAKLSGRKYREPASFEQAITDLRASSGSQLDPKVVEGLINWLLKKQTDLSLIGHSLGACWEMRCCPIEIRKSCPANHHLEGNCWDIPGVKCAAHGNVCETCFVRTEAIFRQKQP